MKLSKKIVSVALALVMVGSLAIAAFGLGIQHVHIDNGVINNSIKAGFLESQKGSGSYSTDKTKVVKQCYVRLQEGDYDSNRVWSEVGAKTGGTDYIWTQVSKYNNPFETCYCNYGWAYYS